MSIGKLLRPPRDDAALARLRAFLGILRLDARGEQARSAHDTSAMIAAGLSTGLLGAANERLARELVPGSDHAASLARQLDSLRRGAAYRRNSQREQLGHVVAAMNEVGIAPLLLSATRDIWLDAHPWRQGVDLGILVEQRQLEAAGKVVEGAGYTRVRAVQETGFRHETCWCHPRTCGYLAMRADDSNKALARMMPSRGLRAASREARIGSAHARVLPPELDVLHAMLTHHCAPSPLIGPSAVTPKALYEFARGLQSMTDDELSAAQRLAAADRQVRDVFAAWIDAAGRCFGLQLPPAQETSDPPSTDWPCADAGDRRAVGFIDAPEGFRIALGTPGRSS